MLGYLLSADEASYACCTVGYRCRTAYAYRRGSSARVEIGGWAFQREESETCSGP